MEELEVIVAHGVFKTAEVLQLMGEEELPEGVRVGLGAGEIEAVGGTEVVGVGVLDEGDDFLGDGVRWEGGRNGDGDFVAVRVAVVGIEGELAARGFGVLHEDAGLLAHGAVEAIHDVGLAGLVGAVDLGEVFCLGGPGGVRRRR